MKAKTLLLAVLLLLFVSMLVPYVYAHPGKTDSSGGHYDRGKAAVLNTLEHEYTALAVEETDSLSRQA